MSAGADLSDEGAAREFAQHVARTLPVTIASVAMLDSPRETLTVKGVGTAHPLPAALAPGTRVSLARAPWHRLVFESNEPMFLPEAAPTRIVPDDDAGVTLAPRLRSIYLVPIRVGDETVGVLGLGEVRAPDREPFAEDKRARSRAILDEFIAASAHAWAASGLRRQLRAMSSMVELVRGVSRARVFDDVLQSLAVELADWQGAPVRGVLLSARSGAGLVEVARWQLPPAVAVDDGRQLVLALARAGGHRRWPLSLVRVGDDPLDPFRLAADDAAGWTRVGLPLMQGNRLVGFAALYLEADVTPTEWELEALRRRGEIAACGMEMVAQMIARDEEQAALGRASYELLGVHERLVVREALAGLLRLAPRPAPLPVAGPAGPNGPAAPRDVAGAVVAMVKDLLDVVDRSDPLGGGDAQEINDVARRAVEIARSKWDEEPRRRGVEIDLRFEPAPEPLGAAGSIGLLGALVHAIDNAVEALPEGGRISVRTAREAGHVVLSIEDTGPGIPADVRQAAFDPLFSTKGPPHLGLGLAVAQTVARRLGGEATLDSAGTRGTRLVIRIPSPRASTDPR